MLLDLGFLFIDGREGFLEECASINLSVSNMPLSPRIRPHFVGLKGLKNREDASQISYRGLGDWLQICHHFEIPDPNQMRQARGRAVVWVCDQMFHILSAKCHFNQNKHALSKGRVHSHVPWDLAASQAFVYCNAVWSVCTHRLCCESVHPKKDFTRYRNHCNCGQRGQSPTNLCNRGTQFTELGLCVSSL